MKNILANDDNSAVIIFAKMPEPGKVKTRLASDLGNDLAIEFYKYNAAYIFEELSQLNKLGIDCYLFYGIDNNVSEIKKWVNKNFIYKPQTGGDLGNKMSDAFQTVFAHGKNKVIIIGTDIPDLSKDILLNAFNQLDNSDFVISPSHDGGYNFLGMKSFYPEVFQNIKWSSEEVFPKTIRQIKELGLSIKVEESLIDIDDKIDLMTWLSEPGIGNVQLKKIMKKLLIN
ncbi:MAG: TIGR04282 family arsenosugar biosynthesis glycosyltransferase [Bacteroidetes bacterium]|nr:TIGR04282 family arsenosugar biosynthesis glycosyltransferase [Bacteroidota bacterium]